MLWQYMNRTLLVAVVITSLTVNQTFGWGWRCRPACPPMGASVSWGATACCGETVFSGELTPACGAVSTAVPEPCCQVHADDGAVVSGELMPLEAPVAGCCGATDVMPMETVTSEVLPTTEAGPANAERGTVVEKATEREEQDTANSILTDTTPPRAAAPLPLEDVQPVPPATSPVPEATEEDNVFDADLSSDPDAAANATLPPVTDDLPLGGDDLFAPEPAPDAATGGSLPPSSAPQPTAPETQMPENPASDGLEGFDAPADDGSSDTGDIFDGLGATPPVRVPRFVSVRQRALQSRYWSDSTGQFHTLASLVDLGQGEVRLLKENGRYTTVRLTELSRVDCAYVRAIAADAHSFADASNLASHDALTVSGIAAAK